MTFEGRLQDRSRWRTDACSAAKVLDLLSTKTAFLVVRECLYGTRRFEDFTDRIGASAPAVSRALRQLEAAGIVARAPYQEPGARVRDEYVLTSAGEELLPILLALIQWGDKHLQPDGGPLNFVDGDGRAVRVCVTSDDPESAESRDIEIRANLPQAARTASNAE
ncbi:winged helix-turn-helix transcriptional regulator [Mycolicibacterium confluentis]|nr:helix-turn-helix domain-containing protein [Mycolicibacterium confluentis]ORV21441.1 transcriptional regulator [Mycolicibacterium confluentis]